MKAESLIGHLLVIFRPQMSPVDSKAKESPLLFQYFGRELYMYSLQAHTQLVLMIEAVLKERCVIFVWVVAIYHRTICLVVKHAHYLFILGGWGKVMCVCGREAVKQMHVISKTLKI